MSVVVIATKSIQHAALVLTLCWTCAAGANDQAPAAPLLPAADLSSPHLEGVQNDLRRMVSKELRETHEQGFMSISEDEANSFMRSQLAPHFGSPSDIVEQMQILYGWTASSPPLRLTGVIGLAAPDAPHRYYSLIRVYSLPGDITLTLEETDFASIGASVSLVKEMTNSEINGYPGTTTYRRSPERKGLILVSWITESRVLKLSLAGIDLGQEQLTTALKLARAVK